MKSKINTTKKEALVDNTKTAIITSVKYTNEVNVTVYYSAEFQKHFIINTNDSNSFMKLRLLMHELLEDGFKIEWK